MARNLMQLEILRVYLSIYKPLSYIATWHAYQKHKNNNGERKYGTR
jgi:hypothetical protein